MRNLSTLLLFMFFIVSPSAALDRHTMKGARVITVHDGDTVTLRYNGKDVRTRLIGIDAPEMGQRPWGKRAKERLIELMNQTEWYVYVETDLVLHDKYGRLLVYLWTKRGEMINERMVLDGQAVSFVIEPNGKYAKRFRRSEQLAQQKMKGIWQSPGLRQSPSEYRKKHPRRLTEIVPDFYRTMMPA